MYRVNTLKSILTIFFLKFYVKSSEDELKNAKKMMADRVKTRNPL
jgi:hypothetical protein